jgi:hypothetical protein
MSLILDGSNGLSDVDGTAATPAIRGTDANTGIFFPAADTIAFSEGGAEAMRIDSAGNLGIGTTSPVDKLTVVASGSALSQIDSFETAQLRGSSVSYLRVSGGSVDTLFGSEAGGGSAFIGSYTNHPVTFRTNNTERMRVTAVGNLLIGTTTDLVNADFRLQVSNTVVAAVFRNDPSSASTETVLVQNQQTSGDNRFFNFATDTGGTVRGTIDYNRGAGQVRYNTTSDATLKNLIGDSNKQKSVDILNSTKIREYAWKDDAEQKPQVGVIAQELYETYKGAVSVGGEVEKTDKDGNVTTQYNPWTVDKTAFTFHLIAGWQEHQKLIQELKAELDSVKAELATLKASQ